MLRVRLGYFTMSHQQKEEEARLLANRTMGMTLKAWIATATGLGIRWQCKASGCRAVCRTVDEAYKRPYATNSGCTHQQGDTYIKLAGGSFWRPWYDFRTESRSPAILGYPEVSALSFTYLAQASDVSLL